SMPWVMDSPSTAYTPVYGSTRPTLTGAACATARGSQAVAAAPAVDIAIVLRNIRRVTLAIPCSFPISAPLARSAAGERVQGGAEALQDYTEPSGRRRARRAPMDNARRRVGDPPAAPRDPGPGASLPAAADLGEIPEQGLGGHGLRDGPVDVLARLVAPRALAPPPCAAHRGPPRPAPCS